MFAEHGIPLIFALEQFLPAKIWAKCVNRFDEVGQPACGEITREAWAAFRKLLLEGAVAATGTVDGVSTTSIRPQLWDRLIPKWNYLTDRSGNQFHLTYEDSAVVNPDTGNEITGLRFYAQTVAGMPSGSLGRMKELVEKLGEETIRVSVAAGHTTLDLVDRDTNQRVSPDVVQAILPRYRFDDEGVFTVSGDSCKSLVLVGYSIERQLVVEINARDWFIADVKRGKKRMTRDQYGVEAKMKFDCPPRRFKDKIWNPYAPASWRRSGAPQK